MFLRNSRASGRLHSPYTNLSPIVHEIASGNHFPLNLIGHHASILQLPLSQFGLSVRKQNVPVGIAVLLVDARDGIMCGAVTLFERFLSKLEAFGADILCGFVARIWWYQST